LNPATILFGETEYVSEVLEDKEIEIPMPEGTYRAKIKLCADSWIRPRFRTLKETILRAHIDMIDPISKPGKGTQSYNCGTDALYGMTCPADSCEDAIGEVVKSVLRDRRRYPL
jgi:hypothetical protein